MPEYQFNRIQTLLRQEIYLIVDGQTLRELLLTEIDRREAELRQDNPRARYSVKKLEADTGVSDTILNKIINGERVTMNQENQTKLVEYFKMRYKRKGWEMVLKAFNLWMD